MEPLWPLHPRRHPATVVTQPSTFPITTAEAKSFCGIDGSDEDTFVDTLIAASTKFFQQRTGHQLAEATFSQTWDAFPCGALVLDWMPIYSVSWVKYYDFNGTLTTVSSSTYWSSTLSHPPRIIPVYGTVWPFAQLGRPEAVQVQYVAGYHDATAIEEGIELALLNLVKHWYSQRDFIITTGSVPQKIPYSLEELVMTYNVRGYR